MTATFVPPQIINNHDGWGPGGEPDQFRDLPYQPFSKGDRLGKVADWTGTLYQDKRAMNKYQSQFGGLGNQYAYFHDEDESSFQLVDTAKVQKPVYQRGRAKFNQNKLRKERERRAAANMQVLSKTQKSRERDRQRQLRKWQKQFGKQLQDNRNRVQVRNRDASVQVRDDWEVREELDFVRLSKLNLPDIKEPETLLNCGSLEYYDKFYDRVNTKNGVQLKRINRIFHKVTTTEDPVIRSLSKQGNVFATDSIIATLMCCTRSVYSWDIVVQRVGNKLFFDKREESDSDLLSVSETATEPPQDEGNSINSPRNLALEATFINHNFSQQVLKTDKDAERCVFDKKNPFVSKDDEGDVASVGYRYRKYDLGNNINLVCRTEHDGVMIGPNGEQQFINVKTLNEWDSRYCGGVDWRSKLDNQRGAVLATELKNNSGKLAKWTVCSLLAGSDQIKFGYVSRKYHRDSAKHIILGTQQFKPTEFANQINLNMDNGWGILRCIIDMLMKMEEGKYLILKDPNKPMVRLYKIPDNTFESDDDGDDDDDDDDDDSEDDSEDESSEEEDDKKGHKK